MCTGTLDVLVGLFAGFWLGVYGRCGARLGQSRLSLCGGLSDGPGDVVVCCRRACYELSVVV